MLKLSYALCVAGVLAMGFGVWTVIDFPIFKITTESLVHGRLNELIDRSQLGDDDVRSLDEALQFIVINDKSWRDHQQRLRQVAAGGFLCCAASFFVGALMARRLESQLASDEFKSSSK